jgi:hypothetical protein
MARLSGGFLRPVSASKNSVPSVRVLAADSDRVRSRNCDFRASEIRDVGAGFATLLRCESRELDAENPAETLYLASYRKCGLRGLQLEPTPSQSPLQRGTEVFAAETGAQMGSSA